MLVKFLPILDIINKTTVKGLELVKATFVGHGCFILEGSEKIIIDPFITGNPLAVISAEDVSAGLILVSHGHGDHFGDAVQIAKRTGGTIVGVAELARYCARRGAKSYAMNIGGGHTFGRTRVKLTPAWHGSGFMDGDGPAEYLGNPCGFLIKLDGRTVYHSGDTGLFGDMELIGRLNQIDLALLPIGDNFTMGPEDALEAVRLLKPKVVIPMHYNTWPVIVQDPEIFKTAVERETNSRLVVLAPGQGYEF